MFLFQLTMLTGVEAIYVATVLEDCVDQLSVLGHIMPTSYQGRIDADEVGCKLCLVGGHLCFTTTFENYCIIYILLIF